MAFAIERWDALTRTLPESAFAYWPNGTALGDLPAGSVAFSKRHGAATIAWA